MDAVVPLGSIQTGPPARRGRPRRGPRVGAAASLSSEACSSTSCRASSPSSPSKPMASSGRRRPAVGGPRDMRLAYTAGILATLLALGAAVVALRAAGHAVGWGFQFQEPLFVAGLTGLLLAFALNLFGVYRVGLGAEGLDGCRGRCPRGLAERRRGRPLGGVGHALHGAASGDGGGLRLGCAGLGGGVRVCPGGAWPRASLLPPRPSAGPRAAAAAARGVVGARAPAAWLCPPGYGAVACLGGGGLSGGGRPRASPRLPPRGGGCSVAGGQLSATVGAAAWPWVAAAALLLGVGAATLRFSGAPATARARGLVPGGGGPSAGRRPPRPRRLHRGLVPHLQIQ